MPRTPQLRWEAARGKWKVVYLGKKYRFEGGTGKSDRVAKKRADADWKQKKAEIDAELALAKPHRAEYESAISEWQEVMTWSVDHSDEANAAAARLKIRELERRLATSNPPPLNWNDRFFAGPEPLYEENARMEEVYRQAGLTPVKLFSEPIPFDHYLWRDRLNAQAQRVEELGADDTFSTMVEAFLATKRNEVAAGQLSADRAESLRCYLNIAMDFAGNSASVSKIDSTLLASFRGHLLEKLSKKEYSDYYARDVLAGFKLFIRWLANHTDKLETLPKNMDDKRFGIVVAPRKAKTLTIEQVGKLLEKATDRTRLYLLLGLNCAMTQKDMSDCLQEEVDWKKGIIRRKRSKTERCENVPEVSYRLWPATFELLKQERSKDKQRVLLNHKGKPLRSEQFDKNNKLKKQDAVRSAIERLRKNAKVSVTMTMLKKTSASLLRNHRDY